MAVGDITYTNKGGNEPFSAIATGSLIVDADAAANIICGFHPSRVELIIQDANGVETLAIWTNSMTSGHYLSIKSHADTQVTIPTSLGVVVYTGTDGLGFTIPANQTDVADSDVIHWTAFR